MDKIYLIKSNDSYYCGSNFVLGHMFSYNSKFRYDNEKYKGLNNYTVVVWKDKDRAQKRCDHINEADFNPLLPIWDFKKARVFEIDKSDPDFNEFLKFLIV